MISQICSRSDMKIMRLFQQPRRTYLSGAGTMPRDISEAHRRSRINKKSGMQFLTACRILSCIPLQYLLDQRKKLIRHIPQRQVYPCRCSHNSPFVGECKETPLAVVAAHAGVADASERNIAVGYVHDSVIDARSTGSSPGKDVPAVRLAPEIIESQRLLT